MSWIVSINGLDIYKPFTSLSAAVQYSMDQGAMYDVDLPVMITDTGTQQAVYNDSIGMILGWYTKAYPMEAASLVTPAARAKAAFANEAHKFLAGTHPIKWRLFCAPGDRRPRYGEAPDPERQRADTFTIAFQVPALLTGGILSGQIFQQQYTVLSPAPLTTLPREWLSFDESKCAFVVIPPHELTHGGQVIGIRADGELDVWWD